MREPPVGCVVLLEGVCGGGKTTLQKHLAAEWQTPTVAFTQRDTYGPIAPLEDAGTLDDSRSRTFLLETSARITSAARGGATAVVDTLHITQRVRPGVLSHASFHAVDADLATVPTLVALLVIDAETIRHRTIEQRRGTGFERYIRKFGRTDEKLLQYFVEQQDAMRRLATMDSRLPAIVLTGDDPCDQLARQVRAALAARDAQ